MSSKQIIKRAKSASAALAWFIRLVGLLLEYAGFRLLGDPLVTTAAIVPVLSKVMAVGVNAVALPSAFTVAGVTRFNKSDNDSGCRAHNSDGLDQRSSKVSDG